MVALTDFVLSENCFGKLSEELETVLRLRPGSKVY